VLQKIFFAPTSSSQTAGAAFIERLARRGEDLDAPSGPAVVAAQMAVFQFHDSFTRHAVAFLASDSQLAPY
jgi:hypothetical protein